MNIPNNMHFGLGFGFKYQYLLSTLLHALITGNNLLSDNKKESCKKYMIKKLADNPSIHANVPYFMEQITTIFPNIETLTYNRDALLLLEGEDGCFEDINLFTTNNFTSKINFIQVKGSEDSSNSTLNKAVRKTLINMLENNNIQTSFQLIILINDTVTDWYYLRDNGDKIKMINTMLKTLIKVDKDSGVTATLRILILRIFDLYLTELYSIRNININIYAFFMNNSSKEEYEKIKVVLTANNSLLIIYFHKLKKIIVNTKIIDKLDHRLIYLFLKYHYGNDKLTKILWNIEMKSMDGKNIEVSYIKEELKKISFIPIKNIQFSKNLTSRVFNKGKIL